MVLSNAERQARYRARLKEAAEKGVTPEMIHRARRLLYEQTRREDPSIPSWDEFVQRSRTKRKIWEDMLPDDPAGLWDDAALSPEDAELLRKVAAVIHAIKEVRE